MGSIMYFGIDSEFSEESFMPDMEITQASNEISEDYTATASVSILVKSKNGDVLTSDGLVEMLEIENEIIKDPDVVEVLETPALPSANVNSVADIIGQMALARQNITFPTIEQKIGALQFMSDPQIKDLVMGILISNQTLPQIKGMFSMMLTKRVHG
jgi:predicted RND superfamily exporter protein